MPRHIYFIPCVFLLGLPIQASPAVRGADDGLRQAFEKARYSLKSAKNGVVQGENNQQRLSLEFRQSEARLTNALGRVSLFVKGYGYGDRLLTPTPVRPTVAENRVEYRRGDLTEWYVNEPSGLEQGFTLNRRPAMAQDGQPLTIALAVAGDLRAQADARGSEVLLKSGAATVLHYSGLRAWDARGHALSARLEANAREIRLTVDDRTAEYPLVVDPTWTQQQELIAPDGADDAFGYSVAVDGDTAVVGAFNHQVGSNVQQGAAYVFTQSGTTWTLQQKLTASDGAEFNAFGGSVAVSGNTVLIGAVGHQVGPNGDQGAAYVFTWNGTAWTQQQELTASDGAVDDYFGASVALDGDTAVVGAYDHQVGPDALGAAYVFTRAGTTWTQQQELTASDGVGFDEFGASVAVSGNTAVIGAWSLPIDSNLDQGAAYVFTSNGTTWSQQQELIASDGATLDFFGYSVAVSGNTAVVGAPGRQIGSNLPWGAAYVFMWNGITWTEQQESTAPDETPPEQFGISVALSGNTAVIGASNYSSQGAAYLFTRNGSIWSQQQELTASVVGTAYGEFGSSVAVNSNTAVIGGPGQGAAYIFTLPQVPTTMNKTQGDRETTVIGTAFPTQLQVTVLDQYGHPITGKLVTFTVVPGQNGAAGTFASTPTQPVTTDSNGVATAPVLTANGFPGTFTVVASDPPPQPLSQVSTSNSRSLFSPAYAPAPAPPPLSTTFTLSILAAVGPASPSGPAISVTVGPNTAPDSFQIHYFAHLDVSESFIDITNNGASAGNLCVNVYAFDASEEMLSCCSCTVTPNGLASLAVKNSFLSNTLTNENPSSLVVDLLATDCVGQTASGLAAWGTTVHQLPGSGFGTTETAFSHGVLSQAEADHLNSFCGFIQSDGSGYGICSGCLSSGQ